MKLNSFGETIRRVEAERLETTRQAIANGWTPDQHPATCCPAEPKQPAPKRGGRTGEELQRLRDAAERRAKWWADAVTRKQATFDNREAARPRFDHGMLNTPVGPRARQANTSQRLWAELEHRKERAAHFARLQAKYEAQIEKRTP